VAICLGWFGVREASAHRVIEELRAACAIANREDIPEIFRVFEQAPPARGLAFWRKQAPMWTLVLLEGSGSQYAVPAHSAPMWAQALSLRLSRPRPTISFFLLEGGWSYAVFDSGNEVVAQESYTLPVPEVYGDRKRGAEVLGIDSPLFDKYEQALKEGREEPFPGDEFAPTDEWGHTDFARHVGLFYPDDPSGGAVYTPSATEIQSAGAAWKGLPARLEAPEPPPHPAAKGEEIDFENFPSGDEPF
jgi:hypothetical protein